MSGNTRKSNAYNKNGLIIITRYILKCNGNEHNNVEFTRTGLVVKINQKSAGSLVV
jgi:hypothetical protein